MNIGAADAGHLDSHNRLSRPRLRFGIGADLKRLFKFAKDRGADTHGLGLAQ